LQAFTGDGAAFTDVEAQLRECVELRQQAPQAPRSRYPSLAAVMGIVALALLGWWLVHWWRSEQSWQDYVNRLRAEPGIVITDVGKRHGQWQISGLRDPVAIDPEALLRESAIDPKRVVSHWQPYQGLNPSLVLKRLVDSLKPPAAVSFSIASDQITAHGAASYGWLQRARAYTGTLPAGAPRVDLSQVRDINGGALDELREAIQAKAIRFGFNEPLPPPSEDPLLDGLAAELRQLQSLAAALHVGTRVTVTGHSDATGKGTANLSLSLARAEAVRALLKKRNVDPNILSIRGAGPLEPLLEETNDAARSADRRVSLTVEFDE
jgi:outer membrane protein OmpA-like peptidoglycan-associated protein